MLLKLKYQGNNVICVTLYLIQLKDEEKVENSCSLWQLR